MTDPVLDPILDPAVQAILDKHGLSSLDARELDRLPASQAKLVHTHLMRVLTQRKKAAELAQKRVNDDPSPEHLDALEAATRALAAVVANVGDSLDALEARSEVVHEAALSLEARAVRAGSNRSRTTVVSPKYDTSVRVRASRQSNISIGGQRVGMDELVEELAAAVRDVARSGGYARVATMHPTQQLARLGEDVHENDAIIRASIDAQKKAIRASGGVCLPGQVLYDFPVMSSTSRPIRDALPRFNADRGSVRFMQPPLLSDVASGVTLWTHATDVTPGESTKGVVTINCPSVVEEFVDAIAIALKLGNFRNLYMQEQVQAWLQTLAAAQARLAESTLYTKMVAAATPTAAEQVLGAARDVLVLCDRAGSALRSRKRLNADDNLVVIMPAWLRDLMRADLTRTGYANADDIAISDGQIDALFTQRHCVPVWSIDIDLTQYETQAEGQLNGFPESVDLLMFPIGAFLHLDGGSLDVGVVRDAQLVGTNDLIMFSEIMESVVLRGSDDSAITINAQICADGSTSLAEQISPCYQGS